MKQLVFISFILLATAHLFGQKNTYTQSIRGIVMDIDTDKPIEGVMVVVVKMGNELTFQTDVEVGTGKQTVICNLQKAIKMFYHTVGFLLISYI